METVAYSSSNPYNGRTFARLTAIGGGLPHRVRKKKPPTRKVATRKATQKSVMRKQATKKTTKATPRRKVAKRNVPKPRVRKNAVRRKPKKQTRAASTPAPAVRELAVTLPPQATAPPGEVAVVSTDPVPGSAQQVAPTAGLVIKAGRPEPSPDDPHLELPEGVTARRRGKPITLDRPRRILPEAMTETEPEPDTASSLFGSEPARPAPR